MFVKLEVLEMTENQEMLLELIRSSEDPAAAIETAVHIISDYLTQHGSYPKP